MDYSVAILLLLFVYNVWYIVPIESQGSQGRAKESAVLDVADQPGMIISHRAAVKKRLL